MYDVNIVWVMILTYSFAETYYLFVVFTHIENK